MLHRLDHGTYCHHSLLAQARTASGSSGNGNSGVVRNNCGIAAETEAVMVAARVATINKTAVVVLTVVAVNNQQNSGGSVDGGSGDGGGSDDTGLQWR